MLTMKIYLGESGTVESLDKDFPIIQGQVNNILLNIFVPTALLSPNFKTMKFDEDTGEFISGTAVKIACKSLERNGIYKLSQNYYLRFVKKLVKDNIEYALFERKLPKEFAYYFGENTMIINAENIQFANITRYEAKVGKGTFTVKATQPPRFLAVNNTYAFHFGIGNKWYLKDYVVDLDSDYGIIIEDGTPKIGDIIYLLVEASGNTQINVTTSQQVTYDVLQSNNLDKEPEIPASEIDTIEAYLNSLSGVLSEVGGAINGLKDNVDANNDLINENTTNIESLKKEIGNLKNIVVTGENYIGTYVYQALRESDMPSNQKLLDYAKSIKGQSYELQNGDVIIVIQAIQGKPDKRYKYIYNGTAWSYYEILPIETAQNGVGGIVWGTWGVGDTNHTLVDIQNGKIAHIYIYNGNAYIDLHTFLSNNKNEIANIKSGATVVGQALRATSDALGNNIVQTYLTKQDGVTKQYVKDYALPRQFNDAMFLQKKDGEIVFDRDFPSDALTIIKPIDLGEATVFEANQTIKDYSFELSSKNGQTMYLVLYSKMVDTPVPISIHVVTSYAYKGGEFKVIGQSYTPAFLTSQVSTVTLNTIYQNINDNDFGADVIKVSEGDMIKQQVSILNSSRPLFIEIMSSKSFSTYFTMNTNMQAITTAKAVQDTGDSDVDVMSQKATTEFGTPSSLTLSDENETRVTYSQENGITVVSVGEDIRENGDKLQYPTEFTVPIVADGELSMDASADGKKVVISGGANKVMITLHFSQQTNGQLTVEELALLQAKDSNYIEVVDVEGHIEKYYYNATENGYRVYTHIEDKPNLIIKSLTITLSERSWKIQSYNISELVKDKVDKVTARQILYGTNEIGEPTNWKFESYREPNTIMLRDANGKAKISTPTAEDSILTITNRSYVDDGLSGRVAKKTAADSTLAANTVYFYGIQSNGAEALFKGSSDMESTSDNGTFPIRGQYGLLYSRDILSDMPVPRALTNKKYVDDGLSGRVAKKTSADKTLAVNKVYFYGIQSNGAEALFEGGTDANFSEDGTVAIRGTYGLLYSNDILTDMPVPRALTNKKYVDDGLSGKLDKYYGKNNNTVYGVTTAGNQKQYILLSNYKTQMSQNIIPIYLNNTEGGEAPTSKGVLVTNTPTQPYQCANQLYVDAQKVRKHLVEFKTSKADPSMYIAVYSTNTTPFTSIDELPDNITFMALNSGDEYVLLFLKQGTSITECYVKGTPLIRFSYKNTTDYIFVSDTVTEL